jgi:hypothetical protein
MNNGHMTVETFTPAEAAKRLEEASPEEVQKAAQHAEALVRTAQRTGNTALDVRTELQLTLHNVQRQEEQQESPQEPAEREGIDPSTIRPGLLLRIVLEAVLQEAITRIDETTSDDPVDARKTVDRIREGIHETLAS